MRRQLSIWIIMVVALTLLCYFYTYYPQQSMPIAEPVYVTTPDTPTYHNDCLHPCIRYCKSTEKYYMAQSPYYAWNNGIENPLLYESDDYKEWNEGVIIANTPKKGYNSDPNIFLCTNGDLFYIWRECYTPMCDSLGCNHAIVGGRVVSGKVESKKVFCTNNDIYEDVVQCPILISHNGMYYIYAVWYQYEPVRKNKGIAIWEGTSLANPDFVLQDTIPFSFTYTVDKCAQVRLKNRLLFFPIPLYHDMWHFDLFEYDNKLYMVSVAEKGDNIMLSVSNDRRSFKTFRRPLVNNHCTENSCGYRQYYYKPTAFVQNDTLHLFYTTNAEDDTNRNQLYHTSASIKSIIR